MGCESCEQRLTCKELCPAGEAYVNQDYVARDPHQNIVDPHLLDKMPDTVMDNNDVGVRKTLKTITLSHREYQVVMLLILTKSDAFYLKCRDYLMITEGNAWKLLQRVREKLLNYT
jgi:hypothetical protein